MNVLLGAMFEHAVFASLGDELLCAAVRVEVKDWNRFVVQNKIHFSGGVPLRVVIPNTCGGRQFLL